MCQKVEKRGGGPGKMCLMIARNSFEPNVEIEPEMRNNDCEI